MITKQDLETLERLYTPVGKIFLEHLRVDHGYKKYNPIAIHQQQAERIRDLADAIDEATGELTTPRSSSSLCAINQQQGKRIRELNADIEKLTKLLQGNEQREKRIQVLLTANILLKDEIRELTSELACLKTDYVEALNLLHPKGT